MSMYGDGLLTRAERSVFNMLGEAYNLFKQLERLHTADETEFAEAIHRAQNIVLSRPAMEVENIVNPLLDKS